MLYKLLIYCLGIKKKLTILSTHFPIFILYAIFFVYFSNKTLISIVYQWWNLIILSKGISRVTVASLGRAVGTNSRPEGHEFGPRHRLNTPVFNNGSLGPVKWVRGSKSLEAVGEDEWFFFQKISLSLDNFHNCGKTYRPIKPLLQGTTTLPV